ncbi:MAG TPA: GIY-YIG nuclease family protein [bacterium]|nr:GIY-YIG nuclease family protein [bacterium]
MFFYVYILLCQKNNSLYVGFTTDLRQRLQYHNGGKTKTTRERGPIKLLYAESYINEHDARVREIFLKSGRGREVIKKQLYSTLAGIV